MAKNKLDPAAYTDSPPPNLAAYLRDADGAITTITGNVPGAKSATLHAIFSHSEPIKDSIVRDTPAGGDPTGRDAQVDRVLQAAFFLVLHALGPVQPTNSESHFESWWSELYGRAQLVNLAVERGTGVSVEDALDVLRRAKWEWASYSSRRIFAAQLAEEFTGTDSNADREVTPKDMVEIVAAVVSAAEIIVQVCWPRE